MQMAVHPKAARRGGETPSLPANAPFLQNRTSLPLRWEVLKEAITGRKAFLISLSHGSWEGLSHLAEGRDEPKYDSNHEVETRQLLRSLVGKAAAQGEFEVLWRLYDSGLLELSLSGLFRLAEGRNAAYAALLAENNGIEPAWETYHANCLDRLWPYHEALARERLQKQKISGRLARLIELHHKKEERKAQKALQEKERQELKEKKAADKARSKAEKERNKAEKRERDEKAHEVKKQAGKKPTMNPFLKGIMDKTRKSGAYGEFDEYEPLPDGEAGVDFSCLKAEEEPCGKKGKLPEEPEDEFMTKAPDGGKAPVIPQEDELALAAAANADLPSEEGGGNPAPEKGTGAGGKKAGNRAHKRIGLSGLRWSPALETPGGEKKPNGKNDPLARAKECLTYCKIVLSPARLDANMLVVVNCAGEGPSQTVFMWESRPDMNVKDFAVSISYAGPDSVCGYSLKGARVPFRIWEA